MSDIDTVDLQRAYTGTRPVPPGQAFDTARLAQWLRDNVDGFTAEVTIEQFRGGQSNPTYLVSAGGQRHVLRRKPTGVLLPSAHAVDREYRVIRALAGSEVPVPRAYASCEDPAVIGSAFYLMEYVEGRIFWDPTLPDLAAGERAAIYDELNRVVAALHRVDPAAVGLADFGRPGHFVERQVARWTRQYRASQAEPIEAAERLIEWLPQHVPREGETRIVHGDYRLDNVIFDARKPRIVAVLDWELATLGEPLADFAYHAMSWHLPAGAARGLAGIDLAALGIPSAGDYVERYRSRTGARDVAAAEWSYYLVFGMFRLVGILQGVAARARQGNASSAHAAAAGRRARPLAEQAWALARSVSST